ncbi:hypothetical protein E2C01_027044 [Portunus trituberculatus]|uniref:Uncharacterized protein n=1 Tax=Portunus trituberculatus TaxID=210409 RepID=A0A5B7EKI1_PORTR|nr:hypothetical protein [Portunus trituberculatus]
MLCVGRVSVCVSSICPIVFLGGGVLRGRARRGSIGDKRHYVMKGAVTGCLRPSRSLLAHKNWPRPLAAAHIYITQAAAMVTSQDPSSS